MQSGRGNLLLMVMVAFVLSAATPAAGQAVVSPAQEKRAGIAVAALHAARMARSVGALGSVLDPAPLLRLRGDIETADAELAGAAAKLQLEQHQAARARLLYRQGHNVSEADLQKAEQDLAAAHAMHAAARAKQTALLAQASATWGAAIATALRDGGDPLPQLASGKAVLVGLSLPPGKTLAAPPRQAEAEATGLRFSLRLIGPVPRMFGGYPGQGILYEARAQPGVPIGTTVSASLTAGPQRSGFLVPWSAVLWKGAHAFVFVLAGNHRFEPVPIATDSPTERGYFVSERLSRGNRIVVRGAAVLLGGPARPAGGADEDEDD